MEFFIKKLLHQELGYYRTNSDQPGTSRGQYFLISKNHLDFFPPLFCNLVDADRPDFFLGFAFFTILF